MADKLFGALSLCQKAGALVAGFDAVRDAMAAGEAALLLFAGDVSPKTRQRAERQNKNNIPARGLPYTQAELAVIARKAACVLAVTNQDLAGLCLNSFSSVPDKEEPV